MKVYIKDRRKQQGQFQFYMQQFVESAVRQGFAVKGTMIYVVFLKLNSFSAKVSQLRSVLFSKSKKRPEEKAAKPIVHSGETGSFRKLALLPYPYLSTKKKKKAIIVTSRGEALFKNAFPFFYNYEIIPMLWDVWPNSWDSLFCDLKFFECRTVFVTVKAMAEKISKELNIQAFWIPEGIDPTGYDKGQELSARPIELYELGRQKKDYHAILEELHQKGEIKQFYRNLYNADGGLQQLAFPTAEALQTNLSKIKIIISFPQVDTHPMKAGGLDTLTQRYWEAMLSRCLIVGRAPKELVEFVGYDPVINVDWDEPAKQITGILNNISHYQELVDKNYKVAMEKAPWDGRIADLMIEILKDNGYTL